MAIGINLAEKASDKVVKRFSRKSALDGLFTAEWEFTGVKTLKVYNNEPLPLQDYNPALTDGSSRYGKMNEVQDDVQEMIVTQNKSIFGTIDKTYATQQMQIKKASDVLRQTTDEVIIPTVDKYCFGKIAAGAGKTEVLKQAPTSKNIVEDIMMGNAYMSNKAVPDTERVLFMGYTNSVKLKLADQIINLEKAGTNAVVNGVCGVIDKCQVRLVPDDWLPTNVQFMIVRKGTALCPKKIEEYRVLDGAHVVDGKMIVGHLFYDCFVLTARKDGIYVATYAGA